MRPRDALWMLLPVFPTGCGPTLPAWTLPKWVADYEQAGRAAQASGRGMLIYYRGTDQAVRDPTFDALRTAEVKKRVATLVTATAFQSHEPDRRFAAQYGIQRAPALILVHPDGTYHAQTGPQSAERIVEFLEGATPPGGQPARNPHLRRQPIYAWQGSLASAQEAADRTGQSIVLVLDRWNTRDWERLRPMLERREVFARFADMIHCRPSSFWGGTEAARKRFGVANLPAIVIIRADGSFAALELPTGYESIARFADMARSATAAERMTKIE
jgi:hypothetical protein